MTTETTVKTITPTVLGVNRKKYATMRELDGMTEKQIKSTMNLDVKILNKRYGTTLTLDDYVKMLEAMSKPSTTGKREADHQTRDNLITTTQDVLSVVNLATSLQRGNVKLTDSDIVKAFHALGENGDKLTNLCKVAFSPIGGMTMIWNPSSQVKTAGDGLAVYIGGWGDGSKNPRYQYAPRKCPISKRSGYRDDSFDVSVYDVSPKTSTPKTPKAKKTVIPDSEVVTPTSETPTPEA